MKESFGTIFKKEEASEKSEEKAIKIEGEKPPISNLSVDALIGDEEQKRKIRTNKMKEAGSRPQTQLPWTIRSPPIMTY